METTMPATATNETPEQRLEQEVIEWTEAVYTEAEQDLNASPDVKLTAKLIDYIHGRQWNPQSRFGRSRPVNNRVFRQFVEIVGMLTDIEPDFKVKFYGNPQGYSSLQKLMNEMIYEWGVMSDFEMELSQTVMYGLLHTGYGKIQWNGALNGGQGDNEFLPISPINLMVVGSQTKLKHGEVVIYRNPVTLQYLRRRFGSVANAVKPDLSFANMPSQIMRPSKIPNYQWNKLPPALRNLLGEKREGVNSKHPVVLMKEYWMRDDSIWDGKESVFVGKEGANWSYWVEPGMPLYPRGRVIVTAGRKVLEDSCNPYWHGEFPFAQYRPLRVPWQFNGLSPMEPIAAIQNILNKIDGGIMDNINASIEPALVAPKGAFSDQAWDTMDPNAPGAKIRYNNNAPKSPEWRQPPELASYVLPFKQDLMREQDATSGSAAIQQALAKNQVPSGDSLDMIWSSKSINIRLMGRSLKSFLTEIGTFTTCNYLQFSTAKSRAAKFGGAGLMDSDFTPLYGNLKPHGMAPEEFVRLCGFSIRKGSLLNIEKSEEIQMAMLLRKNRDLSRRGLYRKLDANINVEEIEQELKQEALEQLGLGALAAAASGKGQK